MTVVISGWPCYISRSAAAVSAWHPVGCERTFPMRAPPVRENPRESLNGATK
jgi:hypothetical protein